MIGRPSVCLANCSILSYLDLGPRVLVRTLGDEIPPSASTYLHLQSTVVSARPFLQDWRPLAQQSSVRLRLRSSCSCQNIGRRGSSISADRWWLFARFHVTHMLCRSSANVIRHPLWSSPWSVSIFQHGAQMYRHLIVNQFVIIPP